MMSKWAELESDRYEERCFEIPIDLNAEHCFLPFILELKAPVKVL